ncbi:phage holin family protein [Chitiniphilus eburneus]|uniref:Phage holin family protein n=1 Tax=Chitiniphilus eburneus TaxID=2571148 RepID=A0A4U0Q3L1_9NEIS|nr:phage holin family protein [Chitiniphilus eburneus]TJZ75565.1 phage holin family protein [Chitiniphilus eburneus]
MLLLIINAVACAATCLRLLTYRRAGARHRPLYAWLAYVLIVATGTVALRTLLGVYPAAVDPSEVAINIVLCIAVFGVRGNVAELFRIGSVAWDGTERRNKGAPQ